MAGIASLAELSAAPNADVVDGFLSTLLEPCDVTHRIIAPAVYSQMKTWTPGSHAEILDRAQQVVNTLSESELAQFIQSHPRIGAPAKTLSSFSKNEQAARDTFPSDALLRRLETLNAVYEYAYPGLIYVTFVNGRPRSAIAAEIEARLGLALGAPTTVDAEPSAEALFAKVQVHPAHSPAWGAELRRATGDVFLIAHSRLSSLVPHI